MRADEAVGAEATDEETPRQQPKVARAEPERKADQRSGGCGARRPRRGGRVGGLAERAEADVPGVVTHQQGHQRQNDERDACHQQHGASTAEAQHQRGAQGQEQKLPGGGAGREQAQHDAPAFREPAVGDHGPEDGCHGAGAESDHHAPQQGELPRRGHQGGETDAGGDERERYHHNAPDPESVHQSSDERPGQTVEEQVDGNGERHGRARPPELALVATGVTLTTLMTASWQLALLWGVVVGLGTGTMASVLGAMVANRWFTERRGVVLGLLTASSATGQLLFLPLLASMVVRLGWRSAVLLVAGVALVVLPLVALLMRDHPRDIGLRPFGEPPNAPPTPRPPRAAAAAPLIGLALGLRSRDFWLLAGSFFICGLSTNGLVGTHLIPASMEHGIAEVRAASLLACIGVLDIVGTTVSGWLSDRWDNRYLLCWYYGLRGLSLLVLPYALGSTYLRLAAFVIL